MMSAHDAPKGILRKPMRLQMRKKNTRKPKYRTQQQSGRA
jgi:hypothetical protein